MTEDSRQALIDRDAIEDVLLRYCRACDREDERLLTSVFHPDAALEYPDFFTGLFQEIVTSMVQSRKRYSATLHVLTNISIKLDGDVGYSESYIVAHHTYDVAADTCHFIGGGRYLDRFERRAGEWRIAHRTAYMDWKQLLRDDRNMPKPF